MSPLDGQTGGQMTDCSLGGVVWSLWLGHVDDRSRHATDHDHATLGLSLHEMLGDSSSEKVGAVDIDTPQLLDTVVWVADSVKVLGETSRSHEVVNLAVIANDLLDGVVNGIGVGNIGIVGCDLGDTVRRSVR